MLSPVCQYTEIPEGIVKRTLDQISVELVVGWCDDSR